MRHAAIRSTVLHQLSGHLTLIGWLLVLCCIASSVGGCSRSHIIDGGAFMASACDARAGDGDGSVSEQSARARDLLRQYLAINAENRATWGAAGCSTGEDPDPERVACMEAAAICSPSSFIAYLTELNAYLLEFRQCRLSDCSLVDSMGLPCSVTPSVMVRYPSPPEVADAQCACDWRPFDGSRMLCPDTEETDPLNFAIEEYFYWDDRIERRMGQCTGLRSGVPDGYVACVERRAQLSPAEFTAYFDSVRATLRARYVCVVGGGCDAVSTPGRCPTEEELASYLLPGVVAQAMNECFLWENR